MVETERWSEPQGHQGRRWEILGNSSVCISIFPAISAPISNSLPTPSTFTTIIQIINIVFVHVHTTMLVPSQEHLHGLMNLVSAGHSVCLQAMHEMVSDAVKVHVYNVYIMPVLDTRCTSRVGML